MIKSLNEKALLPIAEGPGVFDLFRLRAGEELRLVVLGGTEIHYSVASVPQKVKDGIFRILVREGRDIFWLIVCTVTRAGLILWPDEFPQ